MGENYYVWVKETVWQSYEIEAENPQDAVQKVIEGHMDINPGECEGAGVVEGVPIEVHTSNPHEIKAIFDHKGNPWRE